MSQINSIGAGGGGGNPNVVRIFTDSTPAIASTSAEIPDDNSIPQITEGAEVFSVSISPTDASSNILIQCNLWVGSNTTMSGINVPMALFVDTSTDALAVGGNFITFNGDQLHLFSLNHVVSAGSTSSRTYSIRIGRPESVSIGTLYINTNRSGNSVYGDIWGSSLTVTEIGPTS